MAREPGYCRHKATGQAYVNLGGKVVYLGSYGTEESKERYNRLKAEWLLNRHSAAFKPASSGPVMADVCLAYLDHAEEYYAQSTECANFKLAIRPVSELYGTLPAKDFGAIQYRAVRQWWLSDPNRSRSYVNKQMRRLLRILKWSVGAGMMPPDNYAVCKCVDPLKAGRTTAKEAEPVMPVDTKLVESTLKHMTQVVGDMVRFQMLVGCRPGEVVKIKPSMVDRAESVWKIKLAEHKTAYRGKSRTLYVGPRAQEVLRKYLLRGADDYCFTPIESEQQRRQAATAACKTPPSCGNRVGTNRIGRKPRKAPGKCFTTGTYARSVKQACLRAKLDHWHPNQLRHAAATAIRKQFGLEAAQVLPGHSSADVTQVYAERDTSKAVEVALKIG